VKQESKSPGELHFHYNRDERMAGLPENVGRKTGKGIFRGNRSLIITLLDVVFLVILIVIFSVIIRMRGDTTILPGFSITARAVAFEDRVLVSIKAAARRDHDEEARLRIRMGYPEASRWIEIDGFLPSTDGDEQVYRGALDLVPAEGKITIYFYSNSEQGSMTAKIKEE
jgi:hypothetical protein